MLSVGVARQRTGVTLDAGGQENGEVGEGGLVRISGESPTPCR